MTDPNYRAGYAEGKRRAARGMPCPPRPWTRWVVTPGKAYRLGLFDGWHAKVTK